MRARENEMNERLDKIKKELKKYEEIDSDAEISDYDITEKDLYPGEGKVRKF